MTLWSGSTHSSEPSDSPSCTTVTFQVTKSTWGTSSAVTHVPILTVPYIPQRIYREATQSAEEQERAELPEIHFFSAEFDLLFFPKCSPWKERALPWKWAGLCRKGVEWKWLRAMTLLRQIPGDKPPPPLSTHFLCLQHLVTSAGIPSLTQNFLQMNLSWVEVH